MNEQEKQQEVKDNALTHEQIISEAQRSVDRSLTILNRIITAIGVLVGIFTLIVMASMLLYFKQPRIQYF